MSLRLSSCGEDAQTLSAPPVVSWLAEMGKGGRGTGGGLRDARRSICFLMGRVMGLPALPAGRGLVVHWVPAGREFAALQAPPAFAFPSAPFNSIHHCTAPGGVWGGGGGARAGLCGEGCCFVPPVLQRCCSGHSPSSRAGESGSAVRWSPASPAGGGPCRAGTVCARCWRNPWAYHPMDGTSLGDRERTTWVATQPLPAWRDAGAPWAAEETKSPSISRGFGCRNPHPGW